MGISVQATAISAKQSKLQPSVVLAGIETDVRLELITFIEAIKGLYDEIPEGRWYVRTENFRDSWHQGIRRTGGAIIAWASNDVVEESTGLFKSKNGRVYQRRTAPHRSPRRYAGYVMGSRGAQSWPNKRAGWPTLENFKRDYGFTEIVRAKARARIEAYARS